MQGARVAAEHFNVDGVSVNVMSRTAAVSAIISEVEKRESFSVCTLNLDHFVKLRLEPSFRDAYRRARFVTADGFPIVLAGRIAGVPVTRTTGADLVEPLCGEAARERLPVYLFGATLATLVASAQRLAERFAGLHFVGVEAPSANFDPFSLEADEAITRIDQSGARICFLALGAPKQELFAARCLDRLHGTGLICVGAAFDFIAGAETRAPVVAQKLGLEWLWRVMRNPRRLAPRYARCVAALPRLIAQTIQKISTGRNKRAA